MDGEQIDQINASASVNADNVLHVSLCNLHHADNEEVRFDIRGRQTIQVTGTVLTADSIQTHNTFVEPDAIAPKDFSDFCIEDDQLQ